MQNKARKIYELHDSRIKKIDINNNNSVLIEFGHIPVYIEVDINKFDVWSNNITISLEEINSLEILGSIDNQDYIMDGMITTKNNVELSMFSIDELLLSRKMDLKFWNGCKVNLEYSRINLIKEDSIKKFEEWEGPL